MNVLTSDFIANLPAGVASQLLVEIESAEQASDNIACGNNEKLQNNNSSELTTRDAGVLCRRCHPSSRSQRASGWHFSLMPHASPPILAGLFCCPCRRASRSRTRLTPTSRLVAAMHSPRRTRHGGEGLFERRAK